MDTKQSGGIGFCGALALLFIALKLMGYISWSWLWVLSPLWLPLAIVICVFLVVVFLAVMVTMAQSIKK